MQIACCTSYGASYLRIRSWDLHHLLVWSVFATSTAVQVRRDEKSGTARLDSIQSVSCRDAFSARVTRVERYVRESRKLPYSSPFSIKWRASRYINPDRSYRPSRVGGAIRSAGIIDRRDGTVRLRFPILIIKWQKY